MAELREIRVLIGKRSYRMQTALDESMLSRVMSIVNEVAEAIGDGVGQDHLMMLTCLQLAYSLEKIKEGLGPLAERLEDLPSWLPFAEILGEDKE